MEIPKKILARQHEITADFIKELDKHLAEILSGKAIEMFEIRDIADILHIHPKHLSNTIKLTTGNSPCYYFEGKLMEIAKKLLQDNKHSIATIAIQLTFDPSNFTKFFKRFANQSPKAYREAYLEAQRLKNTETVTI